MYKSIEGSQINQDIKAKNYIEGKILEMLAKQQEIFLAKEPCMDKPQDIQLEAKSVGFSDIVDIESCDNLTPELSSRCCDLIGCSV